MLGLIWIAFAFAIILHFSEACDLTHPTLKKWAKKRVQALGGCSALSAGENPVKYKVPNVKVFVYQQDEDELMTDFLQYYSYMYGTRSLVVMDRDSQKLSVCQTLALYQQCGSKIVTVEGSTVLTKGWVMTLEMYKHKHTFLIPLDADEFIFPFALNSTSEAIVDRDVLFESFNKLPIDGRKYKLKLYSSAQPPRSTCRNSPAVFADSGVKNDSEFRRTVENVAYSKLFDEDPRSKTFFHSHGFLQTDDGNHYGEVKHDRGCTNDHPAVYANFSHFYAKLDAQMVHFSIGSYRGARNKYFRAAANYGFSADSDCGAPGQVAIQYCEPCKLFVNGTDQGRAYFYAACGPSKKAVTNSAVSGWFRRHTLSTAQLLGPAPPVISCKHKSTLKVKGKTPAARKKTGWFGFGRD